MSLAASAANAQGRAVSDEFGPILARTRTVLIPIGPLACDGIKLIFVRAGSAILFSKSGDQRVNFGDVVLLGQNTLSGGEPDDWITVTTVTLGWRGETHDTTTGLIWLRARWYDPATARFLSADPWHGDPSNPISLNRYVYGNADPVNMHDPTGLFVDYTAGGQANTMALHTVVTGMQVGSALRALTVLRQLTAALAVLLATSATVVAVTELSGDDDPGLNGTAGADPDVDGDAETATGGQGANPPTIGSTRNCQPDPADPGRVPRIEPNDWNGHIYPGHVAPRLDKSTFDPAIDVQSLICEALDSGALIGDSNTSPHLSNNPQFRVRVYDMGRPVGTSTLGSPNYITIVTRVSNGTVRTAHPGLPSTW